MNRVAAAAVAAVVLVCGGAPARAGHGVGHYPSYYPPESRRVAVDPAAAAAGLRNKTLHAYLGAIPDFAGGTPDHVKPVESLGAFLVVDFNPASERLGSPERRCAAARGILAGLADGTPGMVFHPYPVTPFHADYLRHLDRVADAKAALGAESAAVSPLKVRAVGRRAVAAAGARWSLASEDWDVSLEEVPLDPLLAADRIEINGWTGPPWVREGWFQAHRLLAPAVTSPENRQAADAILGRLLRGQYLDLTEQTNLERRLIEVLTRGCERVVAGYAPRREFYNDDFSAGVENVAQDSHLGLNSPVFIRTAKLKDYPWNGLLRLGLDGAPEAAWNPVAGFTDRAGRLIWSALGDPAMLPSPANASWISNRLEFDLTAAAKGQSGGIKVPADAVLPTPGTGELRPVGDARFASAKLVYRVLASPFLDGTETGIADLVYPFVLAYRWGVRSGPDDPAYDPRLDAALAGMRDRLVGVRALRVQQTVKTIAPGLDFIQKTPVIEVYLRDAPGDPHQVAALAPPWSTVPWPLLALMEQAVLRGHAAFSRREAERRGVAWLDLARDRSLNATLQALVAEFARTGYRPEALKPLVGTEEASRRWRALGAFAKENRHFLVTNGPYRLKRWGPNSAVLEVVREATFPLGFGAYDRYVHLPRALIRDATREAGRITVRVDVEMIVKVQRHYETTRQPLTRRTTRGVYGLLVVSRYFLIGPDGAVVDAGKMRWLEDGRFALALPDRLPGGNYAALVAVFLDGNSLLPSTKMIRFRVEEGPRSG